MVYILIFLASVVAVLTAVHARWLTSASRSRSSATASHHFPSGAFSRDARGHLESLSGSNVPSSANAAAGTGSESGDLPSRYNGGEDIGEGEEEETRLVRGTGDRSGSAARARVSGTASGTVPSKAKENLTKTRDVREIDTTAPGLAEVHSSHCRSVKESEDAEKKQKAFQRSPPAGGREDIAVAVSGRVCGVLTEEGETGGQAPGLRRRSEWQEQAARGME